MAHQARETARRTGRPLQDVLTDWIRRGAASDEAALLIPDTVYPIYTPYGNEEATQTLLDTLNTVKAAAHINDQER